MNTNVMAGPVALTAADLRSLAQAIETGLQAMRDCQRNAHGGKACFDGDEWHERWAALSEARRMLRVAEDETNGVKELQDEIGRLKAITGPSGKGIGELEEINDGLIAENESLRAALDKIRPLEPAVIREVVSDNAGNPYSAISVPEGFEKLHKSFLESYGTSRASFQTLEEFIATSETAIPEKASGEQILRQGKCEKCGHFWIVKGDPGTIVSVLAVLCPCGHKNK